MLARRNDLSRKMIRDLKENILPFRFDRAVDYCGEILRGGTVVKNADKGLILNARILWTFSTAYRVLKNGECLSAADRAFEYLTNRFWDKENGGGFYMLNAAGETVNPMKSTYTQGFMLHAFFEYDRAAGRQETFAYSERSFRDVPAYLNAELRSVTKLCSKQSSRWGFAQDDNDYAGL